MAQAGEAKVYAVENLAKLSLLEYDKQRIKAAETLNVRVGTLDAEVRRAGKKWYVKSSLIEQTEPCDNTVVRAKSWMKYARHLIVTLSPKRR